MSALSTDLLSEISTSRYLWQDDKHIYRQEKQPDGAYAMTENVDIANIHANIRVSETLRPTNRVTDTLRRRMEDLEVI